MSTHMEQFDRDVREKLGESVEIPEVVTKKAVAAYHKIEQMDSNKQSKRGFRWRRAGMTVAALLVAVAAIGTTTLAANHASLLSFFDESSDGVQEQASVLLNTNVEQKNMDVEKENMNAGQKDMGDQDQTKWVDFRIREAVCDKNYVFVAIEAKPVNPEKYLLVPSDFFEERGITSVDFLNIQGIETEEMTIAEYARSQGKQCLNLYADLQGMKVDAYGVDFKTETDGTLLFLYQFENTKKDKKLKYHCVTGVYPPDSVQKTDAICGKIAFTLTDETQVELVEYQPRGKAEIGKTDLVVDRVTLEKSPLEMMVNVEYHYVGEGTKGECTPDIVFDLYDKNGKEFKWTEGTTIVKEKGVSWIERRKYALTDLPDELEVRGYWASWKYSSIIVEKK